MVKRGVCKLAESVCNAYSNYKPTHGHWPWPTPDVKEQKNYITHQRSAKHGSHKLIIELRACAEDFPNSKIYYNIRWWRWLTDRTIIYYTTLLQSETIKWDVHSSVLRDSSLKSLCPHPLNICPTTQFRRHIFCYSSRAKYSPTRPRPQRWGSIVVPKFQIILPKRPSSIVYQT